MRRRVFTVTILALLTLAPMQTWAECAWVLWEAPAQMTGINRTNPAAERREIWHAASQWNPKAGFSDAASCRPAQAAQNEWEARELAERDENNKGRDVWSIFLFRCLPDTIDPRGPKGGGR